MSQTIVSAGFIIIGNEILSGRTQDANLQFLAKRLNQRGIRLLEARVVADVEDAIAVTVNEMRRKYTYVFTTGGIGPTHDDITIDSIAKAFDVPVVVHPEARATLEAHYKGLGQIFTDARVRMARAPDGASLIENPISKAPGIKIDNVYIMAGVPEIMRAQFDNVIDTLEGGIPVRSLTISCHLPESLIANALATIQENHTNTDVGSYPFYHGGQFGTSLVARGTDQAELNQIAHEIKDMIGLMGGTWIEGELEHT